jgi:hypothetical protein
MDEFFIIKLISYRNGDRGFVVKEDAKGASISDSPVYAKQFATKKEARKSAFFRYLEKKHTRIRSFI